MLPRWPTHLRQARRVDKNEGSRLYVPSRSLGWRSRRPLYSGTLRPASQGVLPRMRTEDFTSLSTRQSGSVSRFRGKRKPPWSARSTRVRYVFSNSRLTRPCRSTMIRSGRSTRLRRGFADYVRTPAFADSLAGLIAVTSLEHVALMCAESVPWRCHRSPIAEALLVHGLHAEISTGLADRSPRRRPSRRWTASLSVSARGARLVHVRVARRLETQIGLSCTLQGFDYRCSSSLVRENDGC